MYTSNAYIKSGIKSYPALFAISNFKNEYTVVLLLIIISRYLYKFISLKLRISAGTANIIEKIKSDTALRSETSKLYQEGNYYYYEDDILGIQDFRRWLRSYGSAITVLEPQSLINEITESVQKTLSYYKKINFTIHQKPNIQ